MNRYLPHFVTKYVREYCTALLALMGALFAVSLYFYSPTDPSWFFYTTESTAVYNKCGTVGACSASLLLYLFGASAWLFLSMLFFIAYVIFVDRSWRSEWDRFTAFAVLLITSSSLLYAYGMGHYTGGMLGMRLYALFMRVGDPFIMRTVLWVFASMAVIVIMRDWLLIALRASMPGFQFLASRRFWSMVHCAFSWTFFVLSRPFVHLVAWLKVIAERSQANADFSQHTVPHQEQKTFERTTFERTMTEAQATEVQSSEWYEDQLWREYQKDSLQDAARSYDTDHDEENDVGDSEVPVQEHASEDVPMQTDTVQNHDAVQEASASTKNIQAAHKDVPYTLPDLDIFIGVDDESDDQHIMQELEARAKILEEKLERFGVSGKVVSIKRGPVVTLFEYRPHIDSKISKIIALEDDLALALQALSIRIIAPIPGRSVVGFEVANKHRKEVFLASVVQSPIFANYSGALPLALGQDTIGNTVFVDLARMPHLLIAGSTGSGKSVALNAMLVSLLCKLSPDQLRLILIDPKRLEFASYADIAHLLFPIVTNPKDAAPILRWVVRTMEERYETMAQCGARSIDDYNRSVNDDAKKLPYIVVIIDELSDLMMTAGKEIEDLIARITQMARAAGIHMIVATQRPSVDVITGLIKVNFPSRISFRVTSKIDSRTILDCAGADKLLGRGDMLFLDSCQASLRRIHGAYVSDKEIEELVAHIRNERPTDYLDISQEVPVKDDLLHEADDTLYQEVVSFLDVAEEVSISLLQRKFRIGYNRSARIMDKLESEGLIEPSTGSKTRKVIR